MKRCLLLLPLLIAGCAKAPHAAQAPAPGPVAARAAIADPTPLQRHVMFFDGDGDGRLTVKETEAGLKRLGLGKVAGLATALVIHAGLSKAAGDGMTIDIARVHRGKHAGDTGVFDAEGRFVPAAFKRLMSFDTDGTGALSWRELAAMIKVNTPEGGSTVAAKGEFGLLLKFAADRKEEDGEPAISEARLRAFYTGTLLQDLARARG